MPRLTRAIFEKKKLRQLLKIRARLGINKNRLVVKYSFYCFLHRFAKILDRNNILTEKQSLVSVQGNL